MSSLSINTPDIFRGGGGKGCPAPNNTRANSRRFLLRFQYNENRANEKHRFVIVSVIVTQSQAYVLQLFELRQ